MNLDCTDILSLFRTQFDQLWHCEKRGETLEVHAPFMMPDATGVTFYITRRGDSWIVSDGAEIDTFFREKLLSSLDKHSPLQESLCERFDVRRTVGDDGLAYFYKRTENPDLLPSLAFDLAHFTLGICGQPFNTVSEEIDEAAREVFHHEADLYVTQIIRPELRFRRNFKDVPGATFSAAVIGENHWWLLSYVSGTERRYFERSLSNSYANFQLAIECQFQSMIAARIAVIDDAAPGYDPDKIGPKLGLLERQQSRIVKWSEKNMISEILKVA